MDIIWICEDCGSEDVYEAVWMEVNGTGGGEPVGDGDYFCENCDNRIYSLIQKTTKCGNHKLGCDCTNWEEE